MMIVFNRAFLSGAPKRLLGQQNIGEFLEQV